MNLDSHPSFEYIKAAKVSCFMFRCFYFLDSLFFFLFLSKDHIADKSHVVVKSHGFFGIEKKYTHWDNNLSFQETGYKYNLLYPQNKSIKYNSMPCPRL